MTVDEAEAALRKAWPAPTFQTEKNMLQNGITSVSIRADPASNGPNDEVYLITDFQGRVIAIDRSFQPPESLDTQAIRQIMENKYGAAMGNPGCDMSGAYTNGNDPSTGEGGGRGHAANNPIPFAPSNSSGCNDIIETDGKIGVMNIHVESVPLVKQFRADIEKRYASKSAGEAASARVPM